MIQVIIISVGYLIIGYIFGLVSLHLWRRYTENPWDFLSLGERFFCRLLWPMTVEAEELALPIDEPIISLIEPKRYTILMMFVWPLKLIWNFPFVVIDLLAELLIVIVCIIQGAIRLLKNREKKLSILNLM